MFIDYIKRKINGSSYETNKYHIKIAKELKWNYYLKTS